MVKISELWYNGPDNRKTKGKKMKFWNSYNHIQQKRPKAFRNMPDLHIPEKPIKKVKPAPDNERCAPTPFASIAWTENADILAEVARSGRAAVTGGFAAETADDEALFAYAAAKLERKGIDFIVANDARSALDAPGNAVAWIARGLEAPLRFGPAAKSACARFIVERAAERLGEKTRRQPA